MKKGKKMTPELMPVIEMPIEFKINDTVWIQMADSKAECVIIEILPEEKMCWVRMKDERLPGLEVQFKVETSALIK